MITVRMVSRFEFLKTFKLRENTAISKEVLLLKYPYPPFHYSTFVMNVKLQ